MIRRASYTAEEFEQVAEGLGSTELIRGEVVELSPGGFLHSRIVMRVGFLLEQWARPRRTGRVLTCEAGVVVESDPATVRGGDVVYVSYERIPQDRKPRGFLRIPPELVVEVLGEDQGWSTLQEKVDQYLAFGVDRVWVVHPELLQVRVFKSGAEPDCIAEDEVLSDDDVLPGFSCMVREFFDD